MKFKGPSVFVSILVTMLVVWLLFFRPVPITGMVATKGEGDLGAYGSARVVFMWTDRGYLAIDVDAAEYERAVPGEQLTLWR